MANSTSLFAFFTQAGPVVQTVMLGLMCLSVVSWSIIIKKFTQLKALRQSTQAFLQQWQNGQGQAPEDLHQKLHFRSAQRYGLASQFCRGFATWLQHNNQRCAREQTLSAMTLSMSVAEQETIDPLTRNLTTLATIGSVSPYIGLFGTVWGIMTSFTALGTAQQASIAMVAPGISEALIATAMGLFAAIPAVIAYNYCTQQINQFADQSQLLQDQLKHHTQQSMLNAEPTGEVYAE